MIEFWIIVVVGATALLWVIGGMLQKPRITRMPCVGELWYFDPQDNGPWPAKEHKPVQILAVRDGWVRYDLLDSRMKVRDFVRMYKLYAASNRMIDKAAA